MTAMIRVNMYTKDMLGDGQRNGGSVASLTPVQECYWIRFRNAWDEINAEIHQEKWGSIFEKIMRERVNDLIEGRTMSFSAFMKGEKRLILQHRHMFFLPYDVNSC